MEGIEKTYPFPLQYIANRKTFSNQKCKQTNIQTKYLVLKIGKYVMNAISKCRSTIVTIKKNPKISARVIIIIIITH